MGPLLIAAGAVVLVGVSMPANTPRIRHYSTSPMTVDARTHKHMHMSIRTTDGPHPHIHFLQAIANVAFVSLVIGCLFISRPWNPAFRDFSHMHQMPYPVFWVVIQYFSFVTWLSHLKAAPVRVAELVTMYIHSQVRAARPPQTRRQLAVGALPRVKLYHWKTVQATNWHTFHPTAMEQCRPFGYLGHLENIPWISHGAPIKDEARGKWRLATRAMKVEACYTWWWEPPVGFERCNTTFSSAQLLAMHRPNPQPPKRPLHIFW